MQTILRHATCMSRVVLDPERLDLRLWPPSVKPQIFFALGNEKMPQVGPIMGTFWFISPFAFPFSCCMDD